MKNSIFQEILILISKTETRINYMCTFKFTLYPKW